ncbi:betaine/proline/choline family ABC transporter ATP-binding protein [Desemzia incerta]|uniref:Quaternary amine transport ATP-binding protein n=1 Tax=Desemzia incerta TaxID=82801 RepID=A0A1I5WW59_9LACT|nr:betaine/proline/choline family ABC transporter ATP-binding protein [Desemzia incerta]SFQ23944.1 osmoprotectant transport system ATP-binding protein [Desemzia incerta]
MIEFKNVSKTYKDGTKAVENINLTFNDGEFIVFIGTSGSGKTTSMRMINRMNEPTKGQILIDGEDIMKKDPVELRRGIGYVIQQIGLMPHMTVYDNITLVPKLLKWPEEKKRAKAEELIKRVDLPVEFLDRYPNELSGGQQQRIGVIRALAADQDIILMDEPFGALDPITRDALQELVKHLQSEMGRTVVFVTHDMDEALQLADRIVIMQQGKVVQFDTPDNILANPANKFVEDFLGEDRLLQARPSIQTVDQIMLKNPASVTPGKSLQDAIRIMRDRKIDSLFVTDDSGVLKGLVGLEAIDRYRKTATSVGDVMEHEVRFVRSGTLLRDTVQRMLKIGFKNIPVVDQNDRLIGLVTRGSLAEIVYDNIWGDIEDAKDLPLETTADINSGQ